MERRPAVAHDPKPEGILFEGSRFGEPMYILVEQGLITAPEIVGIYSPRGDVSIPDPEARASMRFFREQPLDPLARRDGWVSAINYLVMSTTYSASFLEIVDYGCDLSELLAFYCDRPRSRAQRPAAPPLVEAEREKWQQAWPWELIAWQRRRGLASTDA